MPILPIEGFLIVLLSETNTSTPFYYPHLFRLGGISSTISAYDSLTARGYDVDVVVMMDGQPNDPSLALGRGGGVNSQAVRRHLSRAMHRLGLMTEVMSIPPCPPPTEPAAR